MKILAHRGFWNTLEEKNSLKALNRAFQNGYGIETDIRDYLGELVISHNIPDSKSPKLEELLSIYSEEKYDLPLALNVKSDGIQSILKKILIKFNISNYFMFDMSIPEQVVYIKEGFRTFTRQSEFEKIPVMYSECEGVWIDEFKQPWISEEILINHLKSGKKIGIISSEIHGNSNVKLWNILKNIVAFDNLMLCTDMPKQAEEFFYDQN